MGIDPAPALRAGETYVRVRQLTIRGARHRKFPDDAVNRPWPGPAIYAGSPNTSAENNHAFCVVGNCVYRVTGAYHYIS